ncbi:MAG: hypothetical protein IPH35_18175 [Rhodoferax sp.]|nr:hypothetical protein [Rhodoferax sp.]
MMSVLSIVDAPCTVIENDHQSAAAPYTAPAPQLHKNIELAREFVLNHIECINVESGNEHLYSFLDDGELEANPLPGATLAEIAANLSELLRMASLPAPVVSAHKGNIRATYQRKGFVMVARVCLALLGEVAP